jgi:signal transduction histidine kinase
MRRERHGARGRAARREVSGLTCTADAPRRASIPRAAPHPRDLLSNAVDSLGSQPGLVTVSTAPVGEAGQPPAVQVIVEDTGKGMTEAELERAFQDFYSTKPGGTGLGLSIVRRLVADAGGRLRVETSPRAGSRFIVELPAAGAPA